MAAKLKQVNASENFVKTFENGDFCALAGAPTGENYKPEDNFETFVILNY